MRRLNAELTEKCNHGDTKSDRRAKALRHLRWLSSCLRAFVVAFINIKNFSAASAVSASNVICSQALLADPRLRIRHVSLALGCRCATIQDERAEPRAQLLRVEPPFDLPVGDDRN